MNECVMCNAPLPTECGSMVCERCKKGSEWPLPFEAGRIVKPLKPNTELSFGAGDKNCDFLVYYHRAKPLNRFQIWMYKVCFGIRARNI